MQPPLAQTAATQHPSYNVQHLPCDGVVGGWSSRTANPHRSVTRPSELPILPASTPHGEPQRSSNSPGLCAHFPRQSCPPVCVFLRGRTEKLEKTHVVELKPRVGNLAYPLQAVAKERGERH